MVKKLTTERIIELKKAIHEEQQHYAKLKEEILFLQSSSMDETKVREMWNQFEQEKIQKEREQVRHDQWLKEREEKKLQHERQWRGPYKSNIRTQKSQDDMEPDTTTQQQQSGTSPLLTSLLKSPSQTVQQATSFNSGSINNSNSARIAPTITNLLTGTSSLSTSNNPNIIVQNPSSSSSSSSFLSSSAPKNNISASTSTLSNIIKIDHSSPSSIVTHSQSAPTLITLLDKRSSSQQDSTTAEKQQMLMSIESGGKDGEIVKDEEAELLADFNELIDAEKFDMDEDLEDLNSIIMNPEILEEKISDGEPIKDDSSHATSTDDYDKLKIKQIVETIQDLAGVPDVEPSSVHNILTPSIKHEQTLLVPVEANEMLQDVISPEPEQSSIEMVDENNAESNDSTTVLSVKTEVPDEKVVMISDESSNTNEDKKDELNEKIDTNDGEESQSVKSSIIDDVKDASGDDSNKEPQAFQGISIVESDENSMSSEKEIKEEPTFHPEDSEDAIFEDAKDHHSEPEKVIENKSVKDLPSVKLEELPDTKTSLKPTIIADIEEASHSAIDSDEEVLGVKSSRSNSRRKGADSLKADTPSSSTRSRDHSENDDNRDSTPIRTRSRHSSTAVSESKNTINFSKEQDHSMWKARWEDCSKELQKLKEFSQIIDNKIIQDEIYKKICLHPMNMKIIAKNIETNVSTLPSDIKRDFVLMCTNIIMLNNKGPKFNKMVHDFTKDCLEIIDAHMEIEDPYKSYRRQIKKKT